MQPFRHFLLTHFNVRRSDARYDDRGLPVDRGGTPVRTVEWLEHRFALFERYCLPSVVGQTNQDFLWFIRYDPDAPGDCGARLGRYAAAYTKLRPIPGKTWYAEAIESEISPHTECVITTRIDNDDALHRDAIADIQRHCRPGTSEFINLQSGYFYDHASGLAAREELPHGNFVSFVEHPKAQPLRTVSRFNHEEVAKFGPVRQISGEPRWLIVVHEHNLSNRHNDRRPLSAVDLEPQFPIAATGAALMRQAGIPQDSPPSTTR
jgi:hypothetical protein